MQKNQPNKFTQQPTQTDFSIGLDEHQAAMILGVAVQTLRNWRHLRKGPPYHKYGRRVIYSREGLDIYKNRHRVDPEVA